MIAAALARGPELVIATRRPRRWDVTNQAPNLCCCASWSASSIVVTFRHAMILGVVAELAMDWR